ncbi:uncharacterized protein LOC117252620 [Xyrichtys novacula]|uniref:Uncharacterized protein LOC117252620 n=1 Tax=Xyrichtys novacula TaxID=13765 RepID=A0AAV1G708_XYRNO|nr:uncharacterized protein LOC117252620 [Xyrichtys novacula]
MSRGKELLLSCIVLLNISFIASRPIQVESLREDMKRVGPIYCNLLKAEKDYISCMFGSNPPNYKSNNSVLQGITFPVRDNIEELLDSMCAINVLTFLCLLITQAPCRSVRKGRDAGVVNEMIEMMQEEIQSALKLMNDSGSLLNTPCKSINHSDQVGQGQQSIEAYLASSGCRLKKISPLIQKKISSHLLNISHLAQDTAHWKDQKLCLDCCSLPSFEDDRERHLYVKCELQVLKQRLSAAAADLSTPNPI